MLNPFFKNTGPFSIERLLEKSSINNLENFKKDKIYDVKDLVSATSKDLTFFHSKKYSSLASSTKASYCVTLKNLSKFLPNDCKKIIVENVFDYLDTEPLRFCGKDIPLPYAENLEKLALPSANSIVKKCLEIC